jgi:hypothetical protein
MFNEGGIFSEKNFELLHVILCFTESEKFYIFNFNRISPIMTKSKYVGRDNVTSLF